VSDFRLSPCVERELSAIWEHIARDNPDAADRVVEAAFRTFAELAATPEMGVRGRFKNPRLAGVRFFPVSEFENYLIFYRPLAPGVQVLHVFHGARDVRTLLEESPEF
jgi:toxin ParE1/3/4